MAESEALQDALTEDRPESRVWFALEVFIVLNILTYTPIIFLDVYVEGAAVWADADYQVDACEVVDPSRFVRAPFTGYTCLAFVTAAYAVLCSGVVWRAPQRTNHLRALPILNVAQTLVLLFVGSTAFLHHASASVSAKPWANAAAFVAALFPTSLAALRLAPAETRSLVFWAVLFVAIASGCAVAAALGGDEVLRIGVPISMGLLGALLLLKLVLECWSREAFSRSSLYPLVFAVVFAALGFLLHHPQTVDPGADDGCDLSSPWFRKLHGWAHIAIAAALLSLWNFLYFENTTDRPYFLALLPEKGGNWRGGSFVLFPILPLLPI